MKKHMFILPVFLVAVVALILVSTAPEGWTAPFDEAEFFFECNYTDSDCGVQAFSDAEGVLELDILTPAPDRTVIFHKEVSGDLENFGGLSEEFFETVEPELETGEDFIEFLGFFPAGQYRFIAGSLMSNAMLTHNIPCGPDVYEVITEEDEEPLSLEVDDFEVDGEVNPDVDLIINWDTNTGKFDTNPPLAGDPLICIFPGTNIVNIEFVLEEDTSEIKVLIANLPGTATSITVPAAFLDPGTEYKFEVIVKEQSGNQTITEVAFETE